MPACTAAASGKSSHRRISRFCSRTARGAEVRSLPSQVSTAASSADAGTTRSTSRQSSASRGGKGFAEQHDLARASPADQRRQQRRLDHRGNAELDLLHAERRRLRRNAHIARRRHFQPAAEAIAVDARDHRDREIADRVTALVQPRDEGCRLRGVFDAGHFVDVGADDERFWPGAGEHDRAQVAPRRRAQSSSRRRRPSSRCSSR